MKIPVEHSVCLSFNRHINLNDVMNYISENRLEMIRFHLDDDFFATIEVCARHGKWKDIDKDITNFETFIMNLEDKFYNIENPPGDVMTNAKNTMLLLKGRLA